MTAPRHARDLMTTPVRFLAKSASVTEAAKFLLDNRLSGAPVADEAGRPVGVFTFRDLAKFFLDPAFLEGGSAPATAPITDFMTPRVHTVKPEATVEDCRKVMRQHRLHRVLVQNADGTMAGIVSVSDIALRAGD
ncbi:MAG: CBS domain-containing protein [Planctomycetia bacterium]|nr:CBS domain-containing protein [Planctomycetia bacterium]